jgi:hypothetical protein
MFDHLPRLANLNNTQRQAVSLHQKLTDRASAVRLATMGGRWRKLTRLFAMTRAAAGRFGMSAT